MELSVRARGSPKWRSAGPVQTSVITSADAWINGTAPPRRRL